MHIEHWHCPDCGAANDWTAEACESCGEDRRPPLRRADVAADLVKEIDRVGLPDHGPRLLDRRRSHGG